MPSTLSATSSKSGKVICAAALISGICIGVSYFNLPIVSGIAGLIPACLMTCIVWLFSLSIGLLYAEATLGQPQGANFITISRNLLGKFWMILLAAIFFIDMFTYLTAYQYFSSRFVIWFFSYGLDSYFPEKVASLIILVLFAGIVLLGVRVTARVNFILFAALLITFACTIFYGSGLIIPSRLLRQNWTFIFFAVPIAYSALSYAVIMPTICTYLNRNIKKIRLSILIGTSIPFVFYLLWQLWMIGSVSRSAYWIMYEQGVSIDVQFSLIDQFPSFAYLLNFMVFFSVTTSMLGIGLVFTDFLCDGFNITFQERRGLKRVGVVCIVFIPTFLCAMFFGYYILSVTKYFTAPIGEVLINGIVPVWMAAQARYFQKLPTPYLLPGGRWVLAALGITLFILIYLEGIQFIRS